MASGPGPRHNFPTLFRAIKFGGKTWIGLFLDPGFGYNTPSFSSITFDSLRTKPKLSLDINDSRIFTEWYNDIAITKEQMENTIEFNGVDPDNGQETKLKVKIFGFSNVGDPHFPAFNLPDGFTLGAGGLGSYALFYQSPTTSEYELKVEMHDLKAGWNGSYFNTIAAIVYDKGIIKVGATYPRTLAEKPFLNGKYGEVSHLEHTFKINPVKNTIEDIF